MSEQHTNQKTIFRTVFSKDFTVLPNDLLRNRALSYKARGVLAMLLTNREDWEVTSSWIQDQGTEGREAIASAMAELEAAGYITHAISSSQGGKFARHVWTIYDMPRPEAQRSKWHARQQNFKKIDSDHEREAVNGKPATANRLRETVDGFPATKKDYVQKTIDQKTIEEETATGQGLQNGEKDLFQEPAPTETFPAALVRDAWNTRVPSLAKIRDLNGSRLRAAKARRVLATIADWQAFFDRIEASDFLTGRANTGREWKADLDWCLNPANFDKILEGRYDNRTNTPTRPDDRDPNQWSHFQKPSP